MYNISTLNKISKAGINLLSSDYKLSDSEDISNACGIILRSYKLHDTSFPPSLLAIARAGAGVNNIPIDRCSKEGIVVFNTPGANANAVKELILTSLLASSRNLVDATNWVKSVACTSTDVAKDVEKGKGQFAGTEIMGKTIGVAGLGAIGVMVANACLALGMSVAGYDPFFSTKSALALDSRIIIKNSIEDLVAVSDFITLHIPATKDTTGLFNEALFAKTKDGATLLNFSRDLLVDEPALVKALASGKIKKYITDFATPGLINDPKVITTPHLGASTVEAEENCAIMATTQLRDFIENGNIANSVNFPACSLGTKGDNTRVVILAKDDVSIDEIKKVVSAKCNILNTKISSRNGLSVILIDVDATIAASDICTNEILRVRVLS